jgi:GNAT superfamily N-acetyltransferase
VELAKLAVTPSAQGKGIGRRLCERVIELARTKSARKIVLTSARKLAAAVRLYESLGFVHFPMPADVPYETADVYMELSLTDS